MQGFRGMHWDALRWEEVFDGTQGGNYISMPFIKDVLYICHLGLWMLYSPLAKLLYARVGHRRVGLTKRCCQRSGCGCRCPQNSEVDAPAKGRRGPGRCVMLAHVSHDKVEGTSIVCGKINELSEILLSQDITGIQTVKIITSHKLCSRKFHY